MAEQPIRKHVNISARDSAQLELRLHWFARALAERQGYIVALLRRANASGRQVATVSYELQLPHVRVPAAPQRQRSALQLSSGQRDGGQRDGGQRGGGKRAAQHASSGARRSSAELALHAQSASSGTL